MNVELLLKVKAAILAEPRAFNMSQWSLPAPDAPCGTACCIAGWAKVLDMGLKTPGEASKILDDPESGNDRFSEGTDSLQLSVAEEGRLCYWANWPAEFSEQYYEARSRTDRTAMAKAGADRIDHFIATKGRE